MSMNKVLPVSRKNDIVIQELKDEILIYDLKINKAFCLNETSAAIWQKCDGTRSIQVITQELKQEFGSSITEEFVSLALMQLNESNLLENEDRSSGFFNGLSRRDLIRKVGLGSFVALPIVSSLMAPTAAQAQSNCFGNNNMNQSGLGCTCNSASDCASTCCGDDGANNICVTPALDPNGSVCRAACECAGNCCAGSQCFTAGAFGTGTACVSSCQCANSCVANLCT